jgi:hypothetical protein
MKANKKPIAMLRLATRSIRITLIYGCKNRVQKKSAL